MKRQKNEKMITDKENQLVENNFLSNIIGDVGLCQSPKTNMDDEIETYLVEKKCV